jgi:hypothetical protein
MGTAQSKSKLASLEKAVSSGTAAQVSELLIDTKADVNVRVGGYRQLPLIVLACQRRLDSEVRRQLSETPLLGEDNGNSLAIVKLLVEARANVHDTDHVGTTPLIAASSEKKPELVRFLLDKKADPNAQDKSGVTPLKRAACHKDKNTVEILLAAKANLNKTTVDYNTSALMEASRVGGVDVVKALLAANADCKIKDKDGKTALEHAYEAKSGKKKRLGIISDQPNTEEEREQIKQDIKNLKSCIELLREKEGEGKDISPRDVVKLPSVRRVNVNKAQSLKQ